MLKAVVPEVVMVYFAVLADWRNACAVGAPAEPGLRIFSPEPAAMRFFLGVNVGVQTYRATFSVLREVGVIPASFTLAGWHL
jgi:hypothetical protein